MRLRKEADGAHARSKVAGVSREPSAIDWDDGTVEVGALGGGEKEDGVRDFLGLAGSTEWDVGEHGFHAVVELPIFAVEKLFCAFAENGAGCDAVGEDALRPKFNRHGACEVDDTGLGGGVGALEACRDEAHDRRDVDDATGVALQHVFGCGFADEEQTGEIDAEDAIPFFDWKGVNVHAVGHGIDPSVIHEDVDLSVRVDEFCHGGLNGFFVGDIHANSHGIGGSCCELARTIEVDVGEDDFCTVGGECGADGLSDGSGGTGDEGDFILEIYFHG